MFDRRQLLAGVSAAAACGKTTPSPAAPPRTRFGVNCFDLFLRPFRSPAAASNDPRRRMTPLAKAGLSFVRFAACGLWPSDWKASLPDHRLALSTMDRITGAARDLGLGCVPSLFWSPGALSDAMGLHLDSWNDPDSPTWASADHYIDLMVQRYARDPITMWEFGNELDLAADWPNSERYYPRINVAKGSLARRSAADRYSAEDVARIYSRFAARVRRLDSAHPIAGGSSIPRADLIHNRLNLKGLDDPAQYEQALELFVPGGIDVVSVHIYPSSLPRIRAAGSSYFELLSVARRVADRHDAQLFVGEFGVAEGDTPDDRREFDRQIQAIIDVRADYAALWAYDFDMDRARWSVDPTGPRSWQFDALAAANR